MLTTSDLNDTFIAKRFQNLRLINRFRASMSSNTELTYSMTKDVSITSEINSVVLTTSNLLKASHLLILLSV